MAAALAPVIPARSRSGSICCLCSVLAGIACGPGGPSGFALGGGGDYLDPELRAAVEQLQSDVAATPTDETTIAKRARVLADWADAYALAGDEVGLEGPRVRLRATLPPRGPAARRASADIDRLVREFTLRDEPGALGVLQAESGGRPGANGIRFRN